jgi:hypothetical protein
MAARERCCVAFIVAEVEGDEREDSNPANDGAILCVLGRFRVLEIGNAFALRQRWDSSTSRLYRVFHLSNMYHLSGIVCICFSALPTTVPWCVYLSKIRENGE